MTRASVTFDGAGEGGGSGIAALAESRRHLRDFPALADGVVLRPRVTDELARRIEAYPVVHVVAPAGSGKTTAVVQAVSTLDRSAAWLTAEPWQRTPWQFLESLAEALEPIVPAITGEVARARAGGLDANQVAAIVGTSMHRRNALLIVDDTHVIADSAETSDMLAVVVRAAAAGLHLVLVGRSTIALRGLGVDAYAPEATFGDAELRATSDEISSILRARNSTIDPERALRQTGGWVAGLLFEAWMDLDSDAARVDPLADYLAREVRPRLDPEEDDILVAASSFDVVDARRAAALGARDPQAWLGALRTSGIPATWGLNGSEVRLHGRIREVLAEELASGPIERMKSAFSRAAEAYEREGERERAFELYLRVDDEASVQRLLPTVVLEIAERHDFELAERYLEVARLDPEPAEITLARLIVASSKGSAAGLLALIDPLLESGRFTAAIQSQPAIGAIACNVLPFRDAGLALDVLDTMPPGRAADAARLILTICRDDPSAPIPPFEGDVLDTVIARAIGSRGYIGALRAGQTRWAMSTGAIALTTAQSDKASGAPPFMQQLATFGQAIGGRDRERAQASVAELRAGLWHDLAEAELAIRLERNPARAQTALVRFRGHHGAAILFFRELAGTWEGAAHLLAEDNEAAASVLRETTESMRRGDRILLMPTALIYLAEAEWRLGDETAHDSAADEALEVARRKGTLRGLLLALADFPGVLSRRADAEPSLDSRWHSLGRALLASAGDGRHQVIGPVSAHLREFGEPELVVDGQRVVRPKIRKSLELLSYLLLSPAEQVSREDVLTALWNGRDDDSTRAYLRQALRHLRDVLPEGIAIDADGSMLSIQGAVTSETLELEAMLAEAGRDSGIGRLGHLVDALELVGRGRFLEGSSDVLWIDDRRVRVESLLADARLDAAELFLSTEQHLRALALVDEALDADPLRERAWRLRMRILDLLGDRDGVTAAYASCSHALAELGLEPSAETTALVGTLRR